MGIACRPASATRYLESLDKFFDTAHYVNIATGGYPDAGTTAFYPLWPLVLRGTGTLFGVESHLAMGLWAGALSVLLFIACIHVMVRVARRAMPRADADLAVLLFALNPTSIFHVIGYTESLCSLLLLFLIHAYRRGGSVAQVFAFSLLAGVARPVVVFIPFAAAGAAVLATFADRTQWRGALAHATAAAAASLMAYGLYGAYMAATFGSFWTPFRAQNSWGRTFGLHTELITNPKVVGGSWHVLTWDLIAFYLPIVLLVASLALFFGKRRGIPLLADQAYWFCLLMSVGFGLTNLLTYSLFASLGRHVFALPMIFYALGKAAAVWQPGPRMRKFMVIFSGISYLRWWTRFARAAWIG